LRTTVPHSLSDPRSYSGAVYTGNEPPFCSQSRDVRLTTLVTSVSQVMCIATTEHLIRFEVNACRQFEIHASSSFAKITVKSSMFATNTPCCEVLAVDGLCLVPSTMIIGRQESAPDRCRWPA